ncbi:Z1 domain-containing protein [Parapedobacter deserti]|uniref:Z1 domain-containing protein n=1 Tax=Parapedobacter deserti TaxID=1912957 RepID=A0ABV7JT10_9SPHI
MNSTSYLAIKSHIFDNLRKIEGTLPQQKIEEEIQNNRAVIDKIGYEYYAKVISADVLEPLNEQDWVRMKRELETHFDVKMATGVLIQGEDQQQRDNSWWTSIEKQKNRKYYWERYKNYLQESLPGEVIKTLDDDTDVVMNNIEDPRRDHFSRYGMVVGHVQSGKTGNYAGLVCKAADAGYKFIVVIAGSMNNLRNQTQERLNEAFVGRTNGVQVGAGKGNIDKNKIPYSLTTIERDFNTQDADRASQSASFESINVPVLLVIKKNTNTFKSVITWLNKQYKNKISDHAMLVIDDESDYASVNTKKKDEDPTAINRGIRKLLKLFSKYAYVAYTATPYANIFIDHKVDNENYGLDLFPKDFIYALEAPTNYFGARKIFLDTEERHLVAVNDFQDHIPTTHKKDHTVDSLPDSLLEAVRVFILNIAVRCLRGYGKNHNSMLVHATRFTLVHQRISGRLADYLENIKKEIATYGRLTNPEYHSADILELNVTYINNFNNDEFKWNTVLKKMTETIESIVIRDVHQKTTIQLEYRKDIATNAIVVGGTSVARGFTLEGLSVSYFLRNTIFYDTLMQMGRWFGYRMGYEDLCHIYMPHEKINEFAEIIQATEGLMRDFRLMSENKWTPSQFGLAVQQDPASALQITARNKLRNATDFEYSMRLDGKAKETSVLSSETEDIDHNIDVIKDFVTKLIIPESSSNSVTLWKDVKRETINDFLNKFRVYKDQDVLGITSRMPIGFVKKYLTERNTNWDVALYSGDGEPYFISPTFSVKKEKRKMTVKTEGQYEFNNRQVSSGSAEAVSLPEDLKNQVRGNRGKARKLMERPLLMLHFIQPEFQNSDVKLETLAAFGLSFPGDVLSTEDTIKLKINTVYYSNLLQELEAGEESDD